MTKLTLLKPNAIPHNARTHIALPEKNSKPTATSHLKQPPANLLPIYFGVTQSETEEATSDPLDAMGLSEEALIAENATRLPAITEEEVAAKNTEMLNDVIEKLPEDFRNALKKYPPKLMAYVRNFRLIPGKPVTVELFGRDNTMILDTPAVTQEHIKEIIGTQKPNERNVIVNPGSLTRIKVKPIDGTDNYSAITVRVGKIVHFDFADTLGPIFEYGLTNNYSMAFSGEAGSGKTSVLRGFLRQVSTYHQSQKKLVVTKEEIPADTPEEDININEPEVPHELLIEKADPKRNEVSLFKSNRLTIHDIPYFEFYHLALKQIGIKKPDKGAFYSHIAHARELYEKQYGVHINDNHGPQTENHFAWHFEKILREFRKMDEDKNKAGIQERQRLAKLEKKLEDTKSPPSESERDTITAEIRELNSKIKKAEQDAIAPHRRTIDELKGAVKAARDQVPKPVRASKRKKKKRANGNGNHPKGKTNGVKKPQSTYKLNLNIVEEPTERGAILPIVLERTGEILGSKETVIPEVAGRYIIPRGTSLDKVGHIALEEIAGSEPQLLVLDEILDHKDIEGIAQMVGRGTNFVFTAHADSLANLVKNKTYSTLIGLPAAITVGDDHMPEVEGIKQKSYKRTQQDPVPKIIFQLSKGGKVDVYIDDAYDGGLKAIIDELLLDPKKEIPPTFSFNLKGTVPFDEGALK